MKYDVPPTIAICAVWDLGVRIIFVADPQLEVLNGQVICCKGVDVRLDEHIRDFELKLHPEFRRSVVKLQQ